MLLKSAQFILFGSIFIAACAVGFCIETNILLNTPLNHFGFYSFVFGATLFQYNLHYIVKTAAVQGSERLRWTIKNQKIHFFLLVAGIILIVVSVFSFEVRHLGILLILGVISLLYSFPFLPFGKKKRIKDYGVFKIITLSLLWTLVTVWLPATGMHYDTGLFFFIFFKRFIFMMILCLLFDMRDIEIDRSQNIKTLAVLLGRKKSYLFAYLLIALFIIACILQYLYLPRPNFLIAMLISIFITSIIIELTKKSNSDYIYLAGVDGMMLLQSILIMLFSLKA
ncbi:MAG: UbiA family prenyltransferase [Ginsengibacter sp.]